MTFIDTHTHIYLEEFSSDISDVIHRSLDSGVDLMILPSIDSSHFQAMDLLCKQNPDVLIPLIGLHPSSVHPETMQQEMNFIAKQLQTGHYKGIGEIGIDLYWDKTFLHQQKQAFEQQIAMALDYDIPIVIHQRESFDSIFEVLAGFRSGLPKGIFHCYAGDTATAEKCIEMGFLLGIGGVVTYKNAEMARVVANIDLSHFVLETDAPYLPPVPYRGQRNEPSHLLFIAQKIAEIKLLDISEVAHVTTSNAIKLFSI